MRKNIKHFSKKELSPGQSGNGILDTSADWNLAVVKTIVLKKASMHICR